MSLTSPQYVPLESISSDSVPLPIPYSVSLCPYSVPFMSSSANSPLPKRKPPPFPWVKPSPETPPAARILGGSEALKRSTLSVPTPPPQKRHHEPAKRQETPPKVELPRDPLPEYPPLVELPDLAPLPLPDYPPYVDLPSLPPEVRLMVAALREMAEVIPAGLRLSGCEVIVDPLGFVETSTAILEAVPHTSRLSQAVARRVAVCLRALSALRVKGVDSTP